MSLPDMDDDSALAAMTARLSFDADDAALGRVLAHVSDLSAGPAPQASAGLAAFLAAQVEPAPLAPAAVAVRPRRPRLVRVLGRLAPAGLATKVVLGAAGAALAGTTSFGAAALVGDADDVSNGRTGARVEQPAAGPTQGGGGDAPAATTPATDPAADESSSGGSSSDTLNGGTDAGRPDGSANPAAVDAHTDGRGRDDERAATPGGGHRDPRSDEPARPEKDAPTSGSTGDAGKRGGSGKDGRAGQAPGQGDSDRRGTAPGDAPKRGASGEDRSGQGSGAPAPRSNELSKPGRG